MLNYQRVTLWEVQTLFFFFTWELDCQIYNRFVLTIPIQTLRVNQCGCWEPSDSE